MSNHKDQTDAQGIHNPKLFDSAANETAPVKNASGVLEWRDLNNLGAIGPAGAAGTTLASVAVVDIENPDLSGETGSVGDSIIVYEVVASGKNKWRQYNFDTEVIAPDPPRIVTGSGGTWVSSEDLLTMTQIESVSANASTGVYTGGELSVGTPNTTFSIADGSGFLVDNTTDPDNPTIKKISWTGLTDIPVTNIATHLITFVSIDTNGQPFQQTSRWSSPEARDCIILGVVVHVDKTIVDTVNNQQRSVLQNSAQIGDVLEGIGFVNVDGNIFSAQGANLNINKSAGIMMGNGINFFNEPKDPHKLTLPQLVAAEFQYRFSNGDNGVTGFDIDPDNIDNGAGGLTALSNNQWSVQRIYCFTSNNVKIQRGAASYASRDSAIEGIATEAFITEPSIAANGMLRGFIVVQEGETDLSANATFIAASKFQTVGGASTGVAATLQAAYDNSDEPEIITDSTNNALSLKQGVGASTNIVELKDSSNVDKGHIGTTEWEAKTQAYSSMNTLSDAVTIATDCSLGNVHEVTLTANRTLGTPTNLKDGATYIWIITQDATGSRTLAYNAVFKFPGGDAPVLTATANAVDILTGVSDGTNIYCSLSQDFN